MLAEKNSQIKVAVDKLGVISNDEKFKHALIVREKSIRDHDNSIAYAKYQGIQQGIQQGMQQGIQQGMQQGIQQGFHQGAVEIAKSMKQGGLSLADIAHFTGLSEQQIANL